MNQSEWVQRIEALEQEQRGHYAEGREAEGDALGEAICSLICQGRAIGLSLPDGRRPAAGEEQAKRRRKPAT